MIVRSHIALPPPPHAQDTAAAHGSALGEEEVRATKERMGLDPDEHFYVSDEVYEHMNMVGRGRDLEDEWNGRFEAWREEFPELMVEWGSRMEWSSRARLRERAALLEPLRDPEARHAQGRSRRHERLQGLRPDHDRGAADLVNSTSTAFSGGGIFSSTYVGRNIAWGVREHAMGSAVNGICVHGGMVRPYGSTFLIFSDYMRPAVRPSALMGIPL